VAQANISQITDIEELREIALNNLGYLFMYRRINDLLEDRVNKMNVFEEE
jgi:hypothetical protein